MLAADGRLRKRGALWASVALNALGVVVFAPLAVGRPSPLLPVPLSPFLAGQVGFVPHGD